MTRHESARVPMVSVGIHADTRDARFVSQIEKLLLIITQRSYL